MSVTVTEVRDGPHYPNGVTTDFAFGFKAPSTSELRVYSLLDGLESTISSGSYSVTLAADGEGGTVSFTVAPASALGELWIELDPDFDQQATFSNSGFLPTSVNPPFDRAALRDLWLRDRVERTFLVPAGEAGGTLPSADDRKGKVLAFDSADGAAELLALSSVYDGTQALIAESRTILAGFEGMSDKQSAVLSEPVREGVFVFSEDDYATEVAADGSGRYVAPTSDATGASGAWIRKYPPGTAVSPLWWPNASPDGSTDNAIPLAKAALAAKENGETLTLATPYDDASWGTTEPLEVDMNCSVRGAGPRTCLKALVGFPATLDVVAPTGTVSAPGPNTTKTVPAPLLLFNQMDATVGGLVLNQSGDFRLSGNSLAPVGLMVLGGANFTPVGIRIDATTFAGVIFCGVQNALVSKIQMYQIGEHGFIGMNGVYNSAFIGMDIRQVSVSDVWAKDDTNYPYQSYFTNVRGIHESVFLKGIWEDSASGSPKEHCIRFDESARNRIIGTQLHGNCSGAMIYEGAGTSAGGNIYSPSTMRGAQHDALAIELHGFQSVVRDTTITLFGPAVGSTIVDLIEVHAFASFENLQVPSNNYYSGKLIANLSVSPNDARRISYTPFTKQGTTAARNSNTFADKVDAITHYYDTDLRRQVVHDYRSTIVNKWGDQPTYTAGDTTPSVDCPDDVVMEVANAGAVVITNLDDMRLGQKVTLLFKDANTTLNHGGAFRLNGGVAFVSAAQKSLTLVKERTSPFAIVEMGRT